MVLLAPSSVERCRPCAPTHHTLKQSALQARYRGFLTVRVSPPRRNRVRDGSLLPPHLSDQVYGEPLFTNVQLKRPLEISQQANHANVGARGLLTGFPRNGAEHVHGTCLGHVQGSGAGFGGG